MASGWYVARMLASCSSSVRGGVWICSCDMVVEEVRRPEITVLRSTLVARGAGVLS